MVSSKGTRPPAVALSGHLPDRSWRKRPIRLAPARTSGFSCPFSTTIVTDSLMYVKTVFIVCHSIVSIICTGQICGRTHKKYPQFPDVFPRFQRRSRLWLGASVGQKHFRPLALPRLFAWLISHSHYLSRVAFQPFLSPPTPRSEARRVGKQGVN